MVIWIIIAVKSNFAFYCIFQASFVSASADIRNGFGNLKDCVFLFKKITMTPKNIIIISRMVFNNLVGGLSTDPGP